MSLSIDEIKEMITSSIPDATIEIKDLVGDNNHYSAKISSKIFNNISRIEQHKLVYKSLKGKMGNELHALSITTEGKWKTIVNIKEEIKKTIDQNAVCLFMKGIPEAPQCGFSMTISNILKHLGVEFKGINVLEDESIRQGIKEYSDWPTIPQLYIKSEFIGGCDIVKEMFEKGELKEILVNKKII